MKMHIPKCVSCLMPEYNDHVNFERNSIFFQNKKCPESFTSKCAAILQKLKIKSSRPRSLSSTNQIAFKIKIIENVKLQNAW